MELSIRLKAAILNSPLTSYQLSKLSGVNISVITRFVNGERDIRLKTADKLTKVLGLNLQKR